MIKTLKVLAILATLTIISGCSLFQSKDFTEPLCLPDRPVLEEITLDEQRLIERETLRKLGENDAKLKAYIRTAEELAAEHNTQFKVKCFRDTE